MLAFGTSVVLEDEPLTVNEAAAVSTSPTVNAKAEVVLEQVDVAVIVEIVGGLSGAFKVGVTAVTSWGE